jgi:D-alanyl-lipoteichoic acid acyltransferase DltB (MBOAT superfamily)
VSLSSWLRDYLYVPLGGNRRGKLMQYRNLMLTMLLGGLWHGAGTNFVIWGGLHGLALCAHKLWSERFPATGGSSAASLLRGALGWVSTQAFVLALWIPFRAESFDDALTFLSAFYGGGSAAGVESAAISPWLVFVPLVADHLLVPRGRLPKLPWPRRPYVLAMVLGALAALSLPLTRLSVQSFIYFQF